MPKERRQFVHARGIGYLLPNFEGSWEQLVHRWSGGLFVGLVLVCFSLQVHDPSSLFQNLVFICISGKA